MSQQEKGCVYFFKHKRIEKVKLGYSTEKSPIKHFNAFKEYGPYGSEIIGFIEAYNAKEIFDILCEKFKIRMSFNNWCDLSNEEVESQIELYSDVDDLEKKRQFEIAWAMKVQKSGNFVQTPRDLFFEKYPEGTIISKSKAALEFGVTRATIYNWLKT